MPFHGETKEELYDNIQRSNIGFNSNSWKFVSTEGKDIIRRMLQKSPQLRPSAKILLKHDWFKKKLQSNEKIGQDQFQQLNNQISASPSVLDNRSIYEMLQQNASKGGSKFRKEVMTLLVKQLNEQELHNLIEKFKQIDVDNSGTITIFELHQALKAEGSSVSQEEIEKLILLDQKKDLNIKSDNQCGGGGKGRNQIFILGLFLIFMLEIKLQSKKIEIYQTHILFLLFLYLRLGLQSSSSLKKNNLLLIRVMGAIEIQREMLKKMAKGIQNVNYQSKTLRLQFFPKLY